MWIYCLGKKLKEKTISAKIGEVCLKTWQTRFFNLKKILFEIEDVTLISNNDNQFCTQAGTDRLPLSHEESWKEWMNKSYRPNFILLVFHVYNQ